jgi:hypothetical protein
MCDATGTMRTPTAIRKEYRKACEAMEALEKKNDGRPLPEDERLYFRLYTIKYTLEWVHPVLIKTTSRDHAQQRLKLMGHKQYVFGPVHATLYP